MEVKGERGEQHLLLTERSEHPKVSNTGIYDSDLLCAACDGRLGRYEDYALRLFRRLRTIRGGSGTIADMPDVDGDMLLRFAAGIAWKYTATRPEFGRIDIGPYAEIVRAVALGRASIPSSLDIAVARLIELDGDVYFYRTPVLARHAGINSVRFSVGSFVIYLKTDKRPNDNVLPPECWLKGRTTGKFLMGDAGYFEEGKKHRRLATSAPVRQFFGTMAQRKLDRAAR